MKGKSSFCRCKRQGVGVHEKPSAHRLIRKGAFDPKRSAQRLSVAVAWRCICRTSLLPRHIPRAAKKAPIAEGQKPALLRLSQSRAKGSGSDAIAF